MRQLFPKKASRSGADSTMTTRLQEGRCLCYATLILVILGLPACSTAQVVPALQEPLNLSTYFTLPVDITPAYRYVGTPAVAGYSIGGYLQPQRFVGAELRGQIQRRLNAEHQESIQAGPRFTLHFGHLAPYFDVLGGAGNGWRYRDPPAIGKKAPKPLEGLGGEWTVLSGLDVKLFHRFSIRAGEVSYSKIYLKNWSLTPLNISAGAVYRIR
jgi:hypothetical protein